MAARTEENLVVVLLAVAAALVVGLAATYTVGLISIKSLEEVSNQQMALEHLRDTLSTLKDAETGQRGYLLTGDEHYLEPYNQALKQVQGELDGLNRLAASGELPSSDVQRIGKLAQKKLTELRETIGLRNSTGLPAALQIFETGRGKAIMDEIRELVAEMSATKKEELQIALARSSALVKLRSAIFLVMTVFNLTVLWWASRRILHSISERNKARLQLAESFDREKAARQSAEAAVRGRDDFLAALSHELRTPLSPVLLVASDAAENPDLAPDIREKFRTVLTNVEVQARLVDDLLDTARLKNGKLKLDIRHVDAHAVLREAIQTLDYESKAKGVLIAFHLNAEQCQLFADPIRLKQIFWNVLSNAIKFAPRGGEIAVETFSTGKTFKVTVKDNGIGMTPEELTAIFSWYSQGAHGVGRSANYGGLGLGLAISKRLVELHSGRIQAMSEGRGKGSAFTIELPLISAS